MPPLFVTVGGIQGQAGIGPGRVHDMRLIGGIKEQTGVFSGAGAVIDYFVAPGIPVKPGIHELAAAVGQCRAALRIERQPAAIG